MFNPHIAPGILALIVTILFFAAKFRRAAKRGVFALWGWCGLAMILAAESLLVLHNPWVATFFTPLVWTGYLLLMDALVEKLQGESLLASPRRFFALAFWSVPLWLIFEAYNLRLQNWTYLGLPDDLAVRSIGYVWSFATIWPAIFETGAFVAALGIFSPRQPKTAGISNLTKLAICLCGLAFVTIPALAPVSLGRFLFGAVWVGFILFLDPWNYLLKGHSFLRDFEAGETTALGSFLVAGWTCGILWEFWNYWAAAKWIYIFPIGQAWKVFEMPLLGYLGFPPFALECKVMYEFLRTLSKRFAQEPPWDAMEVARSRSAG